jgi:flagellar assembly protein FliH
MLSQSYDRAGGMLQGSTAGNLIKAAEANLDLPLWSWSPDGLAEAEPAADLPPGHGPAAAAATPAAGLTVAGYGLQEIMEEAETIIRDAQAEADRLLAEAVAKAHGDQARLRETALAQARADLANDPEYAAAKTDLQHAAAALHDANDELRATWQRKIAECETAVLDTSFQIAKRVIGLEIETHPERVLQTVREALGRMSASDVTVRLNPADMPVVQRALLELQSERSAGDMLVFEEDARVERGGCLLTSEHGSVDAQPSTKLAQLRGLTQE